MKLSRTSDGYAVLLFADPEQLTSTIEQIELRNIFNLMTMTATYHNSTFERNNPSLLKNNSKIGNATRTPYMAVKLNQGRNEDYK